MSNRQENEITCEWRIINLCYCGLKNGDSLDLTLTFVDNKILNDSTLFLVLYPRGVLNDDYVSVCLRRRISDPGPEIIELSFKFAFLDKNHLLLVESDELKFAFGKGSVSSIVKFMKEDRIFGAERQKFLPDDVFNIRCTIKGKKEIPLSRITEFPYDIITFQTYRRAFSWRIDGFSTLKSFKNNNLTSFNECGKFIQFSLGLNDEGDIYLEIISWEEWFKSFSFDYSVIDSDGRKNAFDSQKIFTFHSHEKSTLLLSKLRLIQNKKKYLPNDILTLACECKFSNGNFQVFHEENNLGKIFHEVPKEIMGSLHSNQNEPHPTTALVEDLESLYTDAVLCDVELRTSTKTFPAHKSILGARSPVFRRMFCSDMKEKNTGHIDIIDLEDDTVHRMLLYMYTDFFGEIQFECASKLYTAADKYAIFSLKEKCSCLLKDNLSPTNICQLLVLADRHQDDSLKHAAQDFIITHDKEILRSTEWKNFMVTHVQLAADIMYKYTINRI